MNNERLRNLDDCILKQWDVLQELEMKCKFLEKCVSQYVEQIGNEGIVIDNNDIKELMKVNIENRESLFLLHGLLCLVEKPTYLKNYDILYLVCILVILILSVGILA